MADHVYSDESVTISSGVTRQRKKSKWDQPVESLDGSVPLNNIRTVVHNLNLSKIRDELITREIVINYAESTVRYKLTKRQTQEEIYRCTGAVVITRGKYRPPNALNDSEKPLHLHISAGSHLKETTKRKLAVDSAASIIEEMLKISVSSQPASTPFCSIVNSEGQVPQQLETCVFLGFNTYPSLNIAARFRGPNDQCINHIMNETGASVLLRGRGSGILENPQSQESQQPLHLYLSSTTPKSLEDAKLLAENLLDTISVEYGASRVSSSKVYNPVPPPQQLLAGAQSSGNEQHGNGGETAGRASSGAYSTPGAPQASAATLPGMPCVHQQGSGSPNVGSFGYRPPPATMVSYPQPSVSSGTSYSGYGGIYPQATPLQQVSLAQAPSPITSVATPSASAGSALSKPSSNPVSDTERRCAPRRKFQELPVVAKCPAKPYQIRGSTFSSTEGYQFSPGELTAFGRVTASNTPQPCDTNMEQREDNVNQDDEVDDAGSRRVEKDAHSILGIGGDVEPINSSSGNVDTTVPIHSAAPNASQSVNTRETERETQFPVRETSIPNTDEGGSRVKTSVAVDQVGPEASVPVVYPNAGILFERDFKAPLPGHKLVGGFSVPADHVTLYTQVWHKYGHIATIKKGSHCSTLAGIVANLLLLMAKMDAMTLDTVTEDLLEDLEGLLTMSENLEFNVGWLRQRVDSIKARRTITSVPTAEVVKQEEQAVAAETKRIRKLAQDLDMRTSALKQMRETLVERQKQLLGGLF